MTVGVDVFLSGDRDSVNVKWGRPQARWSDDLSRMAGSNWMIVAENRVEWRGIEEAYVQLWTAVG